MKKSLGDSRKFLVEQGVLDQADGATYPTYSAKDMTTRDLTVLLIRQHEFLVNRVGALTSLGVKNLEDDLPQFK